jgi:linoleoyl-CoA desaturase
MFAIFIFYWNYIFPLVKYVDMEIRFVGKDKKDFLRVVKQRVDDYFRSNNISRNATWEMKVKAVVLILLMVGIYCTILSEPFGLAGMLLLWGCLGVVQGMIGINISHDALHGSYSASPTINRWLGYSYDLVGLSSFMWKQTHNGGHHTFTNIAGHDPDIDKPYLLRLSPHDEWHWFHKFQNIYIWFLYSLVGINWILYSDYACFFRYREQMTTRDQVTFFFFKVVNLLLFVVTPLLVIEAPWWQTLLGYLALQLVGGFTVALIFQLAHLVEEVSFPLPDENLEIPEHWGVHEMMTTSNFAPNSRLLNVVLGGLNFQVEHHLFPHISHSHYRKISSIVRETAHEYQLPYHECLTFRSALKSHFRHITKMGSGTSCTVCRNE